LKYKNFPCVKDDKFHRLEAAGLNAIIDGLSRVVRDDRKLLQKTAVVFDGLHASLARDQNQTKVDPLGALRYE